MIETERAPETDAAHIDLDFRRALRDTKADHMKGPGGWWIYRIVDSPHNNASLNEIRTTWTLNDFVDAWRRIDFYEERDRINRDRQDKANRARR